jgi:hypothetical protein
MAQRVGYYITVSNKVKANLMIDLKKENTNEEGNVGRFSSID